MIILAADEGLLDDLDAAHIKRFESELLAHLVSDYPELVRDLADKHKFDDDLKSSALEATKKFKERFVQALGEDE